MGAPKQKWTAEEEAALRAGVIKHGAGKWRTILKDPEFSSVLYLRSNVDLKDKWRNMSVIVNGWGPQKPNSKVPVKRTHHVSKQDDNATVQSDENGADVQPLAAASGPTQSAPPRRGTIRLDNLIMDAIATLKEPGGSNKTAIATYIEDQYWPPQDFKRILSSKLKHLTANGKLIKVKRRYRIAPSSAFSDRRRVPHLLLDRKQIVSPRIERENFTMLTRSQIDLELAKIRTMTPQEAAAAAARAVADAEAAIEEAEEAAREAEAAEADAEAAQAFAEAALKTMKGRTPPKMMIRV